MRDVGRNGVFAGPSGKINTDLATTLGTEGPYGKVGVGERPGLCCKNDD